MDEGAHLLGHAYTKSVISRHSKGKGRGGYFRESWQLQVPNITDVKTTWPASSSDFLICIRYSEYSSVIFCNSCVLQLDKFFLSQVLLQLSSSSISDLVSSQIVL